MHDYKKHNKHGAHMSYDDFDVSRRTRGQAAGRGPWPVHERVPDDMASRIIAWAERMSSESRSAFRGFDVTDAATRTFDTVVRSFMQLGYLAFAYYHPHLADAQTPGFIPGYYDDDIMRYLNGLAIRILRPNRDPAAKVTLALLRVNQDGTQVEHQDSYTGDPEYISYFFPLSMTWGHGGTVFPPDTIPRGSTRSPGAYAFHSTRAHYGAANNSGRSRYVLVAHVTYQPMPINGDGRNPAYHPFAWTGTAGCCEVNGRVYNGHGVEDEPYLSTDA